MSYKRAVSSNVRRFTTNNCNSKNTSTSVIKNVIKPRISIAPMVDVTDRHFRYLARLLTKQTVLYTPMIVDHALTASAENYESLLGHSPEEQPCVAQLGGSTLQKMVEAAKLCEKAGFIEVNINVGCPAESAQAGTYGAALMLDTTYSFAEVVKAMKQAVSIPVTIKCRTGVNDVDSYEHLSEFIHKMHNYAGVSHFIVHARKAILGWSPSENRRIPPLDYSKVYKLKQDFPQLTIELNGGIDSYEKIEEQLQAGCDGVMMGRWPWKNIYQLAQMDEFLMNRARVVGSQCTHSSMPHISCSSAPAHSFSAPSSASSSSSLPSPSSASSLLPVRPCRHSILSAYSAHCHSAQLSGVSSRHLVKPLQSLFAGITGSSRFNTVLTEGVRDSSRSVVDIIQQAEQQIVEAGKEWEQHRKEAEIRKQAQQEQQQQQQQDETQEQFATA